MTIEDKVRGFIIEELNLDLPAEPAPEEFQLMDLVDSVGLFELVSFIEDEFGVDIDSAELTPDHFGTLGSIARLIGSKAVVEATG